MPTQKKNPRQRNRARNKANRLIETSEDVKQEVGVEKISENIESLNLNENAKCNGAEIVLVAKEDQVAPQAINEENNDPIRLIQKVMRAKLLKTNEPNRQDNKQETISSKKIEMEKTSDTHIKKSKSKDKLVENLVEKNAFITDLQKKMENVLANGGSDLPSTLLDNLQKLFEHEPIKDVETSDEEEEYIEYIYKPRQYFLVSLCNFCKSDLRDQVLMPCTRCKMTYYCSAEHMKRDEQHRQLCYALRQVADGCGGHIFYKCGDFTTDQFRSYRIVTIRKVEAIMNRSLTATEQEVILFPRLCSDIKCREYRFNRLVDCNKCGQMAHCKDKPEHMHKSHNAWCNSHQLFRNLIMFQEKFGRLDPSLPSKVLKDIPGACGNTKQILHKLSFDLQDPCEYAALSQIATGPLTAWFALKLCDHLKKSDIMTIHLIGAEIEFEVDVLHKWELFFLHLTPTIKELNVVFVGPELNPRNLSFEQLKKTKSCRICRKNERTVKYHFESRIYHEYCETKTFIQPNLICFFNAGLYRSTGFHLDDTWPETILAAANLKCPVVVTSYTEYEAPLDMTRFVQECNRRLNVVLPPTKNPFASDKPERNFISDEEAPLMFKNFYCFVVE